MTETRSTEIGELAKALAKAQGLIEGAKKHEKNPFFKSKYADLSSVWDACRHPLSENGLAVLQTVQHINDKSCLVTTLVHESGQWMNSILPIPVVKQDVQALGSAITYCRRYALSALVGICPVDDDGEAAMQEQRKEPKKIDEKPIYSFSDVTKSYNPESVVSWLEFVAEKSGKSIEEWKMRWCTDPEKCSQAFFAWQEKQKGDSF